MKKLLIGSTALFAVAALSNTAAAEPTTLKMSGQVDVAYSILDNDTNVAATDGTDGDGIGFGNPATQIIFDWTGATEAGLQYGARLDYRFQSNTTDEQYVFFGGNWGRLVFGGDDGVIDNNVPGGESVLAGDYGWDGFHSAHTNAGTAGLVSTLDTGTDDAMKFSYYSPSFAGFSFGASYIPNPNSGSNTTGSGVSNTRTLGAAGRSDGAQMEGTLAYSGNFDAVGLSLGVGYAYQDLGGSATDDATGLMAGGTISVAGFSLGVGYGDNGDTNCATGAACDAGHWWNAGLAYSFGPGAASIGYMETEDGTDGADDTIEGIYLDVDYRLAEGLQVFGGLQSLESKDISTGVENDSKQLIVGTRVSF
jgi:outer membrane protein OmpU